MLERAQHLVQLALDVRLRRPHAEAAQRVECRGAQRVVQRVANTAECSALALPAQQQPARRRRHRAHPDEHHRREHQRHAPHHAEDVRLRDAARLGCPRRGKADRDAADDEAFLEGDEAGGRADARGEGWRVGGRGGK
eukprot:7388937-Prymnesium_polylepis.1